MSDNAVQRMSLSSVDIDEVRSFGGQHFYPRRFLHPLRRSGAIAARFDLIRFGPLTIGDCTYGADVTLAYDQPDAYQVGVPLGGVLRGRQGGRPILGAGDQAAVFRVGEDVVLDSWTADCRQLGVKISRDLLERQLQTLIDVPVQAPIKLSAQIDLGTGLGRSWAALVRLLFGEFGNPTGMLDHRLIAAHLEESLTVGLLLATDHPYRDALTQPGQAYRPAMVRRAVDVIHAHPEHPYTVGILAQTVGASARTLQAAFRRYLGCSPMAYVRHVRLTRAHDDLRAADPRVTTVTQVAHRWGFPHLGRFAAVYQARYHTTPSRTLNSS